MTSTIKCYEFSTNYEGFYKPLNYVYYTQVASTKLLMEHARELPSIRYLILFGSSITLGCGEESDLDVLVLADGYDESLSLLRSLRRGIKKPIDFIPETVEHFKECVKSGHELYNEIFKKGLIIYEGTSQARQI